MKISIITPSFNQGRFIERTIQSVLSQNYRDLEYIVVDGGSTDETLTILKKYEGRLRWISEKDSGQSNAINKGFRMARGEIVAWLNSDDIYLPGALRKIARYFAKHPGVMMVYGEGYMIDEHDNTKCRFPFTEPKFDLAKLIYYGDYVLQQSTFMRRTVFDDIPMLDESLHFGMDWDLFIRIGKKFRVEYIPEYIGCIREHGEAKTSSGGVRRFRELVKVIRNHAVERYPMAYINYGLDAYTKALFGDKADGLDNGSTKTRIPDWLRRAGLRMVSLYARRVQHEYYADGWIGRQAMFVLPNFGSNVHNSKLVLEGEAFRPNIPLKVSMVVSGKVDGGHVRASNSYLAKETGTFRVSINLPADIALSECFHVRVKNNGTYVPRNLGMSADTRALGFLLKRIETAP